MAGSGVKLGHGYPDRDHNDIKIDPKQLTSRRSLRDRRVRHHPALTPVAKDGDRDQSRAVLYVGETQVLTPAGALPIAFEIGAGSLEEAAENSATREGSDRAHV